MYTVYRVIVSLFFIGTVLSVVYYDLYEDETTLPRLSMLLHYGYWAFLVLTIDFFLQVMIRLKSCIGPAHVGGGSTILSFSTISESLSLCCHYFPIYCACHRPVAL